MNEMITIGAYLKIGQLLDMNNSEHDEKSF